MGSRFFLIPFLPPLSFDVPAEMPLHEVEFFVQLNLSAHEKNTLDHLYALYDLENIRSFLADLPMTAPGCIPHDILREQLENDECSVPGTEEFFALYTTQEERAANAHHLLRLFFKNCPKNLPPFVQQYFRIEDLSRHIMAFLRASEAKKEYAIDPEEIGFDVCDISTWPEIFVPLHDIWHSRHQHTNEIEDAVSRWKFNVINTLTANSGPFSMDRILAYILQLRIVEGRREIKSTTHLNVLERIVKAMQ